MLERPKTGISLLVVDESGDIPRILLSERKGSHGENEYGAPGGHMEHGETFEEAALRELAEEAGKDIRVTYPKFLCVTNLRAYLPKHYVDIGMFSVLLHGEPAWMEVNKSGPWEWYAVHDLPKSLFASVPNLIASYRAGQPYFEGP